MAYTVCIDYSRTAGVAESARQKFSSRRRKRCEGQSHRQTSRQFQTSSFDMEIYGCEVSGLYKINSNDELDRARQGSPTFCDTQYPEFTEDREVNLGPVEFAVGDRILVNAGRLELARRRSRFHFSPLAVR